MHLADCRALLGHAEWADALVWKAVGAADGDDVELRAKLHHLHMVQWAYLHIWRAEPVRPRELSTFPGLPAIRAWAREYYRELPSYIGTVPESALAREIRFPWADRLVHSFGRVGPATWAESVLQLAMHSAYHRGRWRSGCASSAPSPRSATSSPGSGSAGPRRTGAARTRRERGRRERSGLLRAAVRVRRERRREESAVSRGAPGAGARRIGAGRATAGRGARRPRRLCAARLQGRRPRSGRALRRARTRTCATAWSPAGGCGRGPS